MEKGKLDVVAGTATDRDEAVVDRFFEELGSGCNVSRAAQLAGLGIAQAYRRRAKDADFRRRWGEALSIGYARLEMEMLERALVGSDKEIKVAGESRVVRDYDDRMALALLKMHRETVREIDRGVDEQEYAEACERVLAKLKRLRETQLKGASAAANDDGAAR